jgi:hypothetical protein
MRFVVAASMDWPSRPSFSKTSTAFAELISTLETLVGIFQKIKNEKNLFVLYASENEIIFIIGLHEYLISKYS